MKGFGRASPRDHRGANPAANPNIAFALQPSPSPSPSPPLGAITHWRQGGGDGDGDGDGSSANPMIGLAAGLAPRRSRGAARRNSFIKNPPLSFHFIQLTQSKGTSTFSRSNNPGVRHRTAHHAIASHTAHRTPRTAQRERTAHHAPHRTCGAVRGVRCAPAARCPMCGTRSAVQCGDVRCTASDCAAC